MRTLSFEEAHETIDEIESSRAAIAVDERARAVPSYVELTSNGLYVFDWDHSLGWYEKNRPYRLPKDHVAKGEQ